jgi:hypothetical protein
MEATGANNAGFCAACLTGVYPVPIPENLSKEILEIKSNQNEIETPLHAEKEQTLFPEKIMNRDIRGLS